MTENVEITIEYCTSGGYDKRAAGLAAEFKQAGMPNPVRLIPGSGGVFEVRLGSEVLFSKKHSGRFPNPGELSGRV